MLFVFVGLIVANMFIFRLKNKAYKIKEKTKHLEALQTERQQIIEELEKQQNMYNERTQAYATSANTITSSKNEVLNRVDYLNGLKQQLMKSLKCASINLPEFKDLCGSCIRTLEDLEEANTELHSHEVDFKANYENFDEQLYNQRMVLDDLRANVSAVEEKIRLLSLAK